MQTLLWLFLFGLVIGVAVLLVTWRRSQRREASLWGAPETDKFAKWNEDALGLSEVRIAADRPEPLTVAGTDNAGTPEAIAPKRDAAPEPSVHTNPAPLAMGGPRMEPAAHVPDNMPHSSATPARPMRSRPEWWEIPEASGVGALLRSLVEATGGSAAILQPDSEGYAVLAASGAASAAILTHPAASHIREKDARPLAELNGESATVVLGGHEAGLLPGLDAETVGETAVRPLRGGPNSPWLVVDVEDDHPLDEHTEPLISAYADLAARLLGLPEYEVPAAAPPEASGDPMEVATERIEKEMEASREQGRSLSLAIVVPYNMEDLLEDVTTDLDYHEGLMRQRLLAVSGTREVIAMGDLVLGALCELNVQTAEKWVRELDKSGDPVQVGVAVYGPRHVSPNMLRQDAAAALHKTYTSEENCVIVD